MASLNRVFSELLDTLKAQTSSGNKEHDIRAFRLLGTIQLKEYLKKTYGISNEKCLSYTPGDDRKTTTATTTTTPTASSTSGHANAAAIKCSIEEWALQDARQVIGMDAPAKYRSVKAAAERDTTDVGGTLHSPKATPGKRKAAHKGDTPTAPGSGTPAKEGKRSRRLSYQYQGKLTFDKETPATGHPD